MTELPDDDAFATEERLGREARAQALAAYTELIELGALRLAESRPVSREEVAATLGVGVERLKWMDDDELRLTMDTVQQDLRGDGGEPMTRWAWLEAGFSKEDIIDLIESAEYD